VQGDGAPSLQYAEVRAAFVGDDAVFGGASPLAGWRYRVELTHANGRLANTGATIDGRWYVPFWRGSLALRGMHLGRYGRTAAVSQLPPLFVGTSTLVRGYGAEGLAGRECERVTDASGCAAFQGLLGSRMLVANLEYRIPLSRIGLRTGAMEFAPFMDAGAAWNAGDAVAWSPRTLGATSDGVRRPVWSHGVSTRLNAGALIIEFFHARPMQRGGRGVFGVNLAPGW
jgi:outer membrane protein assembly factor BamA